MSPPGSASSLGRCSPETSFNRRRSWPTLGGRETRPWPASQRSSFRRVALRGAAPLRKLRRPFGLMETALAAPRNEIRAVSRATASRSSGTGSVGTLRRLALKRRPPGVHFVRFSADYTTIPSISRDRPQLGLRAPPPDAHLGQRADRPRRVPFGAIVHVDHGLDAAAPGFAGEAQQVTAQLGQHLAHAIVGL